MRKCDIFPLSHFLSPWRVGPPLRGAYTPCRSFVCLSFCRGFSERMREATAA